MHKYAQRSVLSGRSRALSAAIAASIGAAGCSELYGPGWMDGLVGDPNTHVAVTAPFEPVETTDDEVRVAAGAAAAQASDEYAVLEVISAERRVEPGGARFKLLMSLSDGQIWAAEVFRTYDGAREVTSMERLS